MNFNKDEKRKKIQIKKFKNWQVALRNLTMTYCIKKIPKNLPNVNYPFWKEIFEFYSTPQLKIPLSQLTNIHDYSDLLFVFQTFDDQNIIVEFHPEKGNSMSQCILILSAPVNCFQENIYLAVDFSPNPKKLVKTHYELSYHLRLPQKQFNFKLITDM